MNECVECFGYNGYIQPGGPVFMVSLGIDFNDIAYHDSKIWYACEDTGFPVRVYDENGILVESISSSVLPAAHGITFDSSGYLWVSDMNANKIYKISLGVSLERTTWGSIKSTF